HLRQGSDAGFLRHDEPDRHRQSRTPLPQADAERVLLRARPLRARVSVRPSVEAAAPIPELVWPTAPCRLREHIKKSLTRRHGATENESLSVSPCLRVNSFGQLVAPDCSVENSAS